MLILAGRIDRKSPSESYFRARMRPAGNRARVLAMGDQFRYTEAVGLPATQYQPINGDDTV